jgi:hypothetical protein
MEYGPEERFDRRLFRKAGRLTHPAPARQDAPFPGQGRSEVRDAKNNERHVCGRARVGERPVPEEATRTRGSTWSL